MIQRNYGSAKSVINELPLLWMHGKDLYILARTYEGEPHSRACLISLRDGNAFRWSGHIERCGIEDEGFTPVTEPVEVAWPAGKVPEKVVNFDFEIAEYEVRCTGETLQVGCEEIDFQQVREIYNTMLNLQNEQGEVAESI